MADISSSKVYKFKLSDVSVTVTVDTSFCSGDIKKVNPLFELLHYHAAYELFVTDGEPMIVNTATESREYSDAAVCIPPFFEHKATRKKDYRILFSCSASGHGDSDFARFMNSVSNFEITELRINKPIEFCLSELYVILDDNSALADEAASAILKMLFFNLYRENFDNGEKRSLKIDESYLVKIDSLFAKCNAEISVDLVAESLGLSRRQTSRVIKRYYKTTLSKLVTQRRLKVARNMLLSGEYSVSKIVEEVNFPSESYFYSQFKKEYGMTPLKYKKAYGASKA